MNEKLKVYALVKKTFAPRRTARETYYFLMLQETWNAKEAKLHAVEQNGGDRYEHAATIMAEDKKKAVEIGQRLYPGERIEEREVL